MLRFKILSCLCLFLFVSSSCASAAETWQCPDIYVTRFDVNSLNSSATKPGAVGTSNGSIVYNWKNNITYTGTWWEWIGFRFDDLAADTSISDTSGGGSVLMIIYPYEESMLRHHERTLSLKLLSG